MFCCHQLWLLSVCRFRLSVPPLGLSLVCERLAHSQVARDLYLYFSGQGCSVAGLVSVFHDLALFIIISPWLSYCEKMTTPKHSGLSLDRMQQIGISIRITETRIINSPCKMLCDQEPQPGTTMIHLRSREQVPQSKRITTGTQVAFS